MCQVAGKACARSEHMASLLGGAEGMRGGVHFLAANTESHSLTATETGTEIFTETGACTETDTETGMETGSEIGRGAGMETGTETGTETLMETGAETGTEAGTETHSSRLRACVHALVRACVRVCAPSFEQAYLGWAEIWIRATWHRVARRGIRRHQRLLATRRTPAMCLDACSRHVELGRMGIFWIRHVLRQDHVSRQIGPTDPNRQ